MNKFVRWLLLFGSASLMGPWTHQKSEFGVLLDVLDRSKAFVVLLLVRNVVRVVIESQILKILFSMHLKGGVLLNSIRIE